MRSGPCAMARLGVGPTSVLVERCSLGVQGRHRDHRDHRGITNDGSLAESLHALVSGVPPLSLYSVLLCNVCVCVDA